MKTLKFLAAALFLAVVAASCGESGAKTASISTEIYCDHLETCETKAIVENKLKSTEGVKSAEINVSEKKINVTYDGSKTDEQKIKQAIAMTGFNADDVKADPNAYDQLDDCCKKK